MKLNALFLLFLVTLISCNKDVDEFEPYVKTAISFPEVVDLKPIYRQFNAEETSQIDLGQGDILIVPANSIVDQAGEVLTGKIDLSITQIHKKSDLIYAFLNSNISNIDTGQLKNYGIINIKAYQDSKEVFVKNGKQIILKTPSADDVIEGSVWTGKHFTPNNFGWKQATSNSLTKDTWSVGGSSYTGASYHADQFGWISGAKKLSNGHQVCVNLIEGINPKNTKVYFIFAESFCVAELKVFSDADNFCATIPSDTKGHLIIINEEEKGKYRYQNEALTITENIDFSAHPQVTVLEDIILDLNSL